MKSDNPQPWSTLVLSVMRMLVFHSLVASGIMLFAGCATQPSRVGGREPDREELISPQSIRFSNIVSKADRFLDRAKLSWGKAYEVRWQPEPLNRYVVIYPTPKSELGYAGYRAVHVGVSGDVWLVPRE